MKTLMTDFSSGTILSKCMCIIDSNIILEEEGGRPTVLPPYSYTIIPKRG